MYTENVIYKYNGTVGLTKFENPKGFLKVTLKGLANYKNPFTLYDGHSRLLLDTAVPVIDLSYPTSSTPIILAVYLPEEDFRVGFQTLFQVSEDSLKFLTLARQDFDAMTSHMCAPIVSSALQLSSQSNVRFTK